MRGATPYGLRGTALVLPRGTLNNPALRVGNDRSGLYHLPDGSLGLGLQQFEALKVGQAQSVVRSTSPSPVVLPLRVTRAFPTANDNEEVGLELYDGAVAAGLAVAYRETLANYGFKWYGRGGALPGPHAAPAMTLTPAKALFVGNNIYAAGAVSSLPSAGQAQLIAQAMEANANATVRLYTNNVTQAAFLTLQGGSSAHGLTTVQGGASLYTVNNAPLILGTANTARLTLAGDGTATFANNLSVNGNLSVVGSSTLTGHLQATEGITTGGLIRTTGTGINIESTSGLSSLVLLPLTGGTYNGSSQIILASPTPSTLAAFIAYQGGATGFGLNTAPGDLDIHTSAGNLRLGTSNAMRIHIGSNGDTNLYMGPSGYRWFRSTDGSLAATITNVGVQTQGTSPADPVAGWQSMPIIITALNNSPPGIAFHRSGLAVIALYEQGGALWAGGYRIWTDAYNVPATGVTTAQIADGAVTGAKIANNTITESDIVARGLSAEILTQHSIHRPIATYIGPSVQLDVSAASFAGGTWVAVPQLTTPTFNPNDWYYYQVWAQVQVVHGTAGGRIKARVVFRDTGGLRSAFETGFTTSLTPGDWGQLTPIAVFNGAWLSGAFRVEIYSPDVGTASVVANGSWMHVMEMRR